MGGDTRQSSVALTQLAAERSKSMLRSWPPVLSRGWLELRVA
jgi:hypothetical protein